MITDIGYTCEKVLAKIKESDFLFLESNHDVGMLEKGRYPLFLKRWIAGIDGHLSNIDGARAVSKYGSEKLKGVVLSHLSDNNNTPEIALAAWREVFEGEAFWEGFGGGIARPEIYVSTKDCATELFRV